MNWESFQFLVSESLQNKFVFSLGVVTLAYLVKVVLIRNAWKKTEQMQARLMIRRIVNVLAVILVGLVLTSVWIKSFNQLGTFLGIFSAGLAISLKDLLTNVVGWFFIVVRRPYVIGDRVQIGSYAGDVIDVSIFQTTVLEIGNWIEAEQSTGRILHLPNGMVFSQGVANYTKGFSYIWNEIKVLVTFESDWQKARQLLSEIAVRLTGQAASNAEKEIKKASSTYLIRYRNLTPTVYTSVKDSGVLLSIRYLCRARERRLSEHVLWEEILAMLSKQKDIELAYPTQRFYDRGREK